jgi:hypothetical protein
MKFADATTSNNATQVTAMFIARKSSEIRIIGQTYHVLAGG